MVLLFKFLTARFHDEISVLLYLLDEEAPPTNYSNKGLANYFLRVTQFFKNAVCLALEMRQCLF